MVTRKRGFLMGANHKNIFVAGGVYKILLFCIIAIILFAVMGWGVLQYCRHQQRMSSQSLGSLGPRSSLSGSDPCHSRNHHDDEKSNNLQNEENLRRYANPIKEEALAIGGSLASLRMSSCQAANGSIKMTAASVSDLQVRKLCLILLDACPIPS